QTKRLPYRYRREHRQSAPVTHDEEAGRQFRGAARPSDRHGEPRIIQSACVRRAALDVNAYCEIPSSERLKLALSRRAGWKLYKRARLLRQASCARWVHSTLRLQTASRWS